MSDVDHAAILVCYRLAKEAQRMADAAHCAAVYRGRAFRGGALDYESGPMHRQAVASIRDVLATEGHDEATIAYVTTAPIGAVFAARDRMKMLRDAANDEIDRIRAARHAA